MGLRKIKMLIKILLAGVIVGPRNTKILIKILFVSLIMIFLVGINVNFPTTYPVVTYFDYNVLKCESLYSEKTNKGALKEARLWKEPSNVSVSDSQLNKEILSNCDDFIRKRDYLVQIREHNKEEMEFRIAFTMVVYTSSVQVERLLRAIYRPWNYYCIHVDRKSNKDLFKTIDALTHCLNSKYNNIINIKNRVKVTWGKMSTLKADLTCMKSLYERYKDWKYLINLTGQEFPLKTNSELVKILKAYKGANNIDGTYMHRGKSRIPKIRMPFPVVWYKGSTHITANRKFIEFLFKSEEAKIMIAVLKKRDFPDEQLFNTLNFNPQFRIPGSFIGNPDNYVPENYTRKYFLTRYKNWGEYSCESKKVVRQICIWGVGDLPKLVSAPHLFTNKFFENFEPATLKCLEQWYYNKVEKEIRTGKVEINSTFYSSLPFVLYQFQP